MRGLRLVVLLIALVTACTLLLLPTFSGIHGKVIFRSCPIGTGSAGSGCYPPVIQPAQARIDVENAGGAKVASVVSSKDGTFIVQLTPGTYYLSGVTLGAARQGEIGVTRVDVRPVRYEELTLEIVPAAVSQ
jgi:hypothetical protein